MVTFHMTSSTTPFESCTSNPKMLISREKLSRQRTSLPNDPVNVSRRSSKQSEELSQLVQGEVEKKKLSVASLHSSSSARFNWKRGKCTTSGMETMSKASEARNIPRTFT